MKNSFILSYLLLRSIFFINISCNSSKNEKKEIVEKANSKIKFVRKNANSAAAQADLEALQKALSIMRKLNCDSTLSWYYQGAMHWVPDTVAVNPFCDSYHIAPKDLKTAWDNCTHAPNSDLNFLLWHRLYIAYFERIVRKLSGYQAFALPYWGYTDTTNITVNRKMPYKYQQKTTSLFEASRFDSLNNNYPVQGGILPALDLTNLFENTDFLIFSNNMAAAPHGAMHNYIGGGFQDLPMYNPIYQSKTEGGMMAQVPSAGFDPIFWLHHSNIDRLWQQWTNSPRGALVSLADLKKQPWSYHFFDENGKEESFTTEEVYDMIYNVNYDYDDTPTIANGIKSKNSLFLLAENQSDTLIKENIEKKVSTNSPLKFSINNNKKTSLNLLSEKNKEGKLLTMTIEVSFTKEPKGIYEVYVNLPNGVKRDPKNPYYAGHLTFFGAKHHASHGSMHSDHHEKKSGKRITKFVFDMTDEFNATKGFEKDKIDVSIFKGAGKVLDEITIEKVSFSTH